MNTLFRASRIPASHAAFCGTSTSPWPGAFIPLVPDNHSNNHKKRQLTPMRRPVHQRDRHGLVRLVEDERLEALRVDQREVRQVLRGRVGRVGVYAHVRYAHEHERSV